MKKINFQNRKFNKIKLILLKIKIIYIIKIFKFNNKIKNVKIIQILIKYKFLNKFFNKNKMHKKT